MSENPFGNLDLNALLGQAQAMQANLAEAQERLAESTVTGTVAGGAVTVTVSGVGELVKVDLKTGEFDGSDPDALADLGDLIVAAYRDAKAQADALASQSLGPITGGPGGLLGGNDDPQAPPRKLGF
ncbi:YbaB/EbfC family nucleoid-associated protein [Nocardioides sp. Kera G14]|uniref:YbaB/EbfC family nucleoid-associated protein n=1 Tax=Nocardioides sp. Kera G14 TaxID=2884264 RepID=UPI001D103D1C|nr:YbaB/EbfC family nucleoid-associated protein [Nocardioides sp. Kera G14]UDY23722.1 YbaB/EbfC family nucleoid-associated protein [Nocardioides sp. Kera G14]